MGRDFGRDFRNSAPKGHRKERRDKWPVIESMYQTRTRAPTDLSTVVVAERPPRLCLLNWKWACEEICEQWPYAWLFEDYLLSYRDRARDSRPSIACSPRSQSSFDIPKPVVDIAQLLLDSLDRSEPTHKPTEHPLHLNAVSNLQESVGGFPGNPPHMHTLHAFSQLKHIGLATQPYDAAT